MMQSSCLSSSSPMKFSCKITEEEFQAMSMLDEGTKQTQMSQDEDTHQQEIAEGKEQEFSFVCINPVGLGSVISAEDAFQNGHIRPMFPLSDQASLFADYGNEQGNEAGTLPVLWPPLKKLFVAEEKGYASSGSESDEFEGLPEGKLCPWSAKPSVVEVKTSPETCKKSHYTGFSKLWRFRDLINRNNSAGKDTFVFLNSAAEDSDRKPTYSVEETKEKEKNKKKKANAKRKGQHERTKTTTSSRQSAHEKLYLWYNARKGGEKHKSYLPYRQQLLGFEFFTNVNRLSRNVHPF